MPSPGWKHKLLSAHCSTEKYGSHVNPPIQYSPQIRERLVQDQHLVQCLTQRRHVTTVYGMSVAFKVLGWPDTERQESLKKKKKFCVLESERRNILNFILICNLTELTSSKVITC